jgi:hypothetical protein
VRISRRRRPFGVAAAFSCLAIDAWSGCSRQPPRAEVRGEVTFDGEPVENGSIAFQPVDGVGPSAGGEIKRGLYCVRVPPGKKRVEIHGSKRVGKRPPTPENPVEEDIFREFIPPAYNLKSTLNEEVKEPETVLDFKLKPVAAESGQ